jgi:hypothetical protein
MAELDATQMPEDIFSKEVIVDTPELEVVDQEEQEKPKSGGKIQMATEEAKKELAKKFIPKKTIISNLGEIKEPTPTVVKKATTEITKPVAQKPKEVKEGDLLKPDTQDDAAEYKKKYQENEVAALLTGKKPSAPVDIKFELERFLGGSPSSINWDAYDKSKQEEIRRAAAIAVQNDVDPNQDYSGVLTFISRITPNAIKSGVTSMEAGLTTMAGLVMQEFEKAKQNPSGASRALGIEPEAPKPLAPGEKPAYQNIYEIGAKLAKRSEDYMIAAEINSGIKDENVGKNATDLMFSSKPGDTWDGLTKLGLSVTQQIPQLIALATTGGSSGAVFAGSAMLGTGNALTEEYRKDKDISSVDAIQSITKGIIEGATEAIFLGDIRALRAMGGNVIKLDMSGAKKTMKTFLDQKGKKALKEEINRTYFKALGGILKNSLGEGGEEVVSAIGSFIVDRVEDGNWNQEEYDKLLSNIKESATIGFATGFGVSAPLIKASVTPLTMEQKRKIGSFRQVANDPTASKEIRESAQKHADDIIKFNADQVARKYTVMAALPLEKRKAAIDIAGKIQALENGKAKLKDVDAEATIDKDIDKLKQDWSKLIVGHAMETATNDKIAKAKRQEEAPKVTTSKGEEVSQAAESMEVDESMIDGDFDLLKNLTPEQKRTLVNIQNAMQTINPDGNVKLYENSEQMRKGLIEANVSKDKAAKLAYGTSAQLSYDGTGTNPIVHVNLANTDDAVTSAAHEVGHLALIELANENPEAFISMRDNVLRIMKNSQSQPLVDFANKYGTDRQGNLLETAEAKQERAEEFLTQMIGVLTSGDGKIERTVLDQLARIIRDFLLQASRSINSKTLEDLVNKAFAETTSGEQLAKYFEGLAAALKVGGNVDVSYLRDFIPPTPTQEARLEGLTPGTDAYHEAAMLNAAENSINNARPTMEADQSIASTPEDVITRSQISQGNFGDSDQFKKYLKVVKGMTPEDLWLGRALAMEENRGNKLFAIGDKDAIIEQMKKEMDEIEADANNSNKYYLTELKPGYIAAQVKKYELDPALTDNLTEWKMIRDDEYQRNTYIKEKAKEQKGSLTANIAYLKGNDTYSVPFQYAMIKDSIASRYTVVPSTEEGGETQIQRDAIKPSQLNNTEKPIITMQPGILSSAYSDYAELNTEPGRAYAFAMLNMPKIEVENSEFAPFVFKQSDTGEGYWLKFNQSSNIEDAKPLHKIASTSHKYPAQWCTGGALTTANSHLSGGDFYTFVDNKTGDARIAVRYNGKDRISEVRGLGDGQSLFPQDNEILDEIVNTLPGGEEYKKDVDIQNQLKDIIDLLPDEVSKKLFALYPTEFDDWARNVYAKSDNFDKELFDSRFAQTHKLIKDTVLKYYSEAKSENEILDLLEMKDKSYGEKNNALRVAKETILKNSQEVFEQFGYKPNEILGTTGDDAINIDFENNNYDQLRLIIGKVNFLGLLNKEYNLPKLERILGRLKGFDGANVKAPLLKSITKGISVADNNDATLDFPSLEFMGNDGFFIPQSSTSVNFTFGKIKSLTFDAYIGTNVGRKSSLNIPLVEQLLSKRSSTKFDLTIDGGKFYAPNLKSGKGTLIINEVNEEDVNIDKLEEISKISIAQSNINAPSLKYVETIISELDSNLKLNNIEMLEGSRALAVVANTGSSISIDKINISDGSRSSVNISASKGSNISIKEQVRSEYNFLGGINDLNASDNSKIEIPKGLDLSWVSVDASNGSKIISDSFDKIHYLKISNSEFNSESAKEMFDGEVDNGKVYLGNTEEIVNFYVEGNSIFDAKKLNRIADFTIRDFKESGDAKINIPSIASIDKFRLTFSELNISNDIDFEKITLDESKLSVNNLSSLNKYGYRFGGLSMDGMSTFNAPELSHIGTQPEVIIGAKIFAPKLGYNNTSFPDATVTRSQVRLAPNGKPSNLTKEQYDAVRTPEFKQWFGDWENDPENASKFVDDNGEPQVFYHGTYNEFDRFSTDPDKKRYSIHKKGIFFTPTLTGAKAYGDIQMPVFLDAKTFDYNEADFNNSFEAERKKENEVLENTDKEGVVLRTADKEGYDVKQYVVFNPDQIHSAGDKTYTKSQLMGKPKYESGTSAAKQAQKNAEKVSLSDALIATQKEMTERNVNVSDALKNADMMQSFYNMYNKAGGTPYATRMFADARNEIYGTIDGKKLNKRDKGFLDDIILLRRTIAIDENFDNRKAAGEKVDRPLHTSFTDYVTKKEVSLSKEEAQKQLDALKEKVYEDNPAKLAELETRATRYFKAFSDILKYKLDNGLIDQGEYDMYKNYDYQPRKFLKFLLGDTPQSAFNTRGVQITKEEIAKISEGDTGYMMTDSEKLLKMGFVSAVNKVFANRAISWMAEEMEGKNLSWLKPANVDKYANGTEKLNPDGSPKLQDPDAGFRNMYYKKDGKRYAVQLKESFAREFQDEEMWDTRNWLYRTSVKALGANITSAMAVGINPAFIISNIPIDILSQVYYNNLYSSKFGVFGQMGKGFSGAIAKSLSIAKAKTGKGDNSDLLNLINEYGEAGGLMNTLAYETNVLGKVGDALGALGDISEMASKLTAYENKRNDLIREFQKKNGSDPNGVDYDKIKSQAAYEARAAMDYHRGGRTSKWLNGLIPFFNVTTQVGKISASYIKNNFPAFSKKVLQSGGAVMALTLYNMKMAGDDWENEDLKRAKRSKLIIMSPFKNADGTHSYTQIQVPTPIKAFWNVFQTMAEAAYYKGYAPMLGTKIPPVDKDYNKEMMESLKMFMPVATSQIPSTAKFFYEYATNQSLWNQRSLSQDNLRNITISEEGEENKDILSFYKTMAKGASKITDGSIEISPERFQKSSEDAFLTSPENQALLSGLYTITDQMTDLYVGGVDENTRSKYIEDGDFTEAGQALLKTFGKRIVGSTDKTKNELFYDSKEDAKFIERLQRKENSARQNVSNKIKTIFKNYKDADLPYTAAKPEIMEYYKSLTNKEDKEYAKNYIEMSIGKSKVQRTANIPKYLLIAYQAKSAKVKAMAIYEIFTKNGQDPMKDKVLQKDLGSIGFSDEVVKQYKKIVEMEEAKKPAPKVDSQAGLPEGFNPADYQPK